MAQVNKADFMVRAKRHHDIANHATDAEVRRLNDEMALRYTARAASLGVEVEPELAGS